MEAALRLGQRLATAASGAAPRSWPPRRVMSPAGRERPAPDARARRGHRVGLADHRLGELERAVGVAGGERRLGLADVPAAAGPAARPTAAQRRFTERRHRRPPGDVLRVRRRAEPRGPLRLARLGALDVRPHDLGRIAFDDHAALLEQHRAVAVLLDPGHVVGHEHDALGGLHELDDPRLRLLAELGVAGREHLVEQEDVRVDRRRDREPEARAHARRVGLDRRIDELAEVRVLDDRRQELADEPVVEAHERAGEQDVLAPAQVLVEPRAERQQARDVAVDLDRALRRQDDPGQDLEERRLAGAVRAR